MLKSGDICNLRSALPSRGRSLDSVFCIVKLTDKYMYLEYKSSYLTGLGSSTEWLYSVVLYTPRGRRSAPLSITIFSSRNPSQHSCSSITITPLKQFQKFHGRRNSPRCLRRNPHTERKRKILSPAPEINTPIATRTVAKIVAPPHSPTTNAISNRYITKFNNQTQCRPPFTRKTKTSP